MKPYMGGLGGGVNRYPQKGVNFGKIQVIGASHNCFVYQVALHGVSDNCAK